MRITYSDSFAQCNYINMIFLLVAKVVVYILVFERKVCADYENKPFRQSVVRNVLPNYLKTLPDRVVDFTIDLTTPLHDVDKRFLSFSIDSVEIKQGLKNPTLRNKTLIRTISHLKGGYLRIGGTLADLLVFSPNPSALTDRDIPIDDGNCSFDVSKCTQPPHNKTFIMTGDEWKEINEFAITVGLKLLFDLNALLRDLGRWNSSNAQLLLDYSSANHYEIDWQLGNEPTGYNYSFGLEVDPTILAEDFTSLKKLLQQYSLYNSSLVIGPDTNNPGPWKMVPYEFLLKFLEAKPDIDAISWHHYYTDSHATLEDFLKVRTYDSFLECYKTIQETIKQSKISPKPVWLSETGSSYDSGTKGLSKSFAASLLWTDKLGSAAKAGISVVVRQSLYKGEYSLLDSTTLKPNPDYWVSVLYRTIVRETVLNLTVLGKSYDRTLRAYAHCSKKNSIVTFGVNLSNVTQGFHVPLNNTGYLYSLHSDDLLSRSVMLNGKELVLDDDDQLPVFNSVKISLSDVVPIPPYSIFFIRIKIIHPACVSY